MFYSKDMISNCSFVLNKIIHKLTNNTHIKIVIKEDKVVILIILFTSKVYKKYSNMKSKMKLIT